jgi:hypothetical protein
MWDELLRTFRAARLLVTFEVQRDGPAPEFPGAAFRGAFGRALRAATCATGYATCTGCPLTARCGYGYLFETHVPETSLRMRRYPFAPHPFVLRPPPASAEWKSGATLSLEIVLFGRGADYLPFVLFALGAMGADGVGPARIPLRLVAADLDGQPRRRIYDGDALAPGPYGIPAAELVRTEPASDLTLRFVSPARIVHGGVLARELPLHIVVRSLLRRVTSLAYFHERLDLDVDFVEMIERAERVPARSAALSWVDQRRHSARQGRAQTLGGAVGEVTYTGVPHELATLLAVGELTHVGKGTAFGLGRYERRPL